MVNRKEIIPVIISSAVLLLYCWLVLSGNRSSLTNLLFFLSPVLLVWIAYTILRHGKFEGKELGDQEEWGYADKDKNELGIF